MEKMFKTEPFYSPRPWGYELWTLSTHRSGQSLVLPEKEPLKEYLHEDLPILIKIIKADEALSVQVHPGDEYALVHEHDNGKTECWYILEAEEDAKLIVGLEPGMNREKLKKIIEEGRLTEVVEFISVKAGDMIYIPNGTVHAILGGIKLLEIQQSSDSTYRMYDWGRDREMHIEKSLDVIDYANENHAGKIDRFIRLETPYFRVENVEQEEDERFEARDFFQTINLVSGHAVISSKDQTIELDPDQTLYIPKGVDYTVSGNCHYLRTY